MTDKANIYNINGSSLLTVPCIINLELLSVGKALSCMDAYHIGPDGVKG